MAKKKSKKGGPREGSGRKPVEDKAEPITIYFRNSRIEAIGKEEIKISCIELIEKKYKKLK